MVSGKFWKESTMKTINSKICVLALAVIIWSLNLIALEGNAHGDGHFIESLSLIRFDEKIMAQDFALKDLDGHLVHLKDFRGKVVFLNFWATWCPPCRIEMPSMEKLYNKFKDDNFTILAVDMQEDSETVKRFKESFKLSFPILLDEEGAVGAYYGVMGLPATYFIDREGFLYAAALGARDWSSEDAAQLIRHLMAN
jgi:peroxiredoxin